MSFITPTKQSSRDSEVHVNISPSSVSASVGEIFNKVVVRPNEVMKTAAVKKVYEDAVQSYNLTHTTSYTLEDFNPEPVYHIFDALGATWESFKEGIGSDVFHLTLKESGRRNFETAQKVFLKKADEPKKAGVVLRAEHEKLLAAMATMEASSKAAMAAMGATVNALAERTKRLEGENAQLRHIMRRKVVFAYRDWLKEKEGGSGSQRFWDWWTQLNDSETNELKKKYGEKVIKLMLAGDTKGDRVAHDIAPDRIPMAHAVDRATKNKVVLSAMYLAVFSEEAAAVVDSAAEEEEEEEEEEDIDVRALSVSSMTKTLAVG